MRRLWAKLLLGFVAVVVVGVGVVAIAAYRATDVAFSHYVRQGQTQRIQRLAEVLASYYASTRSWATVQPLLDSSSPGSMGRMGGSMGPGMGRGNQGMAMMAGQETTLADASGTIVASTDRSRIGQRLSAQETAAATPITADGRVVGLLLGQGQDASSLPALERAFLNNANRALLLAALLAGALAVAMSLILSRRLTAPLASMTQAVQAMTHGHLDQRVTVQSDDEIGRLAEAFNTMAASLAKAEEMRRNLVADVAHELRTPLAVLRADLEALQDGVYEPSAERLSALREEADLLARLVADLQELSLVEAGQLALERRPTDLAQLCRQVVAAMEPQAAGLGVALTVGRADEGATSLADADRIGQVLRNLVANALRYTGAGGSVTVECSRQGSGPAPRVTISVQDTGAGISPEDLPHVFERFYRGEKSRSRSTGGAGLGLAIARHLVEAHGGRIWAESTLGQGSTFYVELPTQ